MSVTVPTALPMAMSDDGTVVTATDCKITNNSYGAVRVRSVSISAAEGWNLTAFGDKAPSPVRRWTATSSASP